MANRNIFQSIRQSWQKRNTDTLNEAGGSAYQFEPKHALAQLAMTGCFGDAFYSDASSQLKACLKQSKEVHDEFLAKLAVYSREKGSMKDMPALLCAVLTQRQSAYLDPAFKKVIRNGKMLRNYVQIVRSGVTGRKSFGSKPKRLIRQWMEAQTCDALFRAAIGTQPSMADIIKMVHPKPAHQERNALYAYLLGKQVDVETLPELAKAYERFKVERGLPDVPFQRLTSLKLETKQWMEIARNATWTTTRMNLNTFARHGVFKTEAFTSMIAQRLANPELIRRAKPFPYQLMVAYSNLDPGVPELVRLALQDALEVATENVPKIHGNVAVLVDVSGSMHFPVTGYRKGSTSAVRCIDAAALMASCILRKNPEAQVIPFDTRVHTNRLNSRDSVMTNARILSKFGGGGTNCAAGLEALNRSKGDIDLVIMISDNESWMHGNSRQTWAKTEWQKLKHHNPKAKMVCLDIQPYTTTQIPSHKDVLNLGGFSDHLFQVIADFAKGEEHNWVSEIEATTL